MKKEENITKKFRDDLKKIMPGYKWTVLKSPFLRDDEEYDHFVQATGIQTAGFNRLSTLQVTRRKRNGEIEYEAKSSGFGKRAIWLATYSAPTIARALRELQTHYENVASNYAHHASSMRAGRGAVKTS